MPEKLFGLNDVEAEDSSPSPFLRILRSPELPWVVPCSWPELFEPLSREGLSVIRRGVTPESCPSLRP